MNAQRYKDKDHDLQSHKKIDSKEKNDESCKLSLESDEQDSYKEERDESYVHYDDFDDFASRKKAGLLSTPNTKRPLLPTPQTGTHFPQENRNIRQGQHQGHRSFHDRRFGVRRCFGSNFDSPNVYFGGNRNVPAPYLSPVFCSPRFPVCSTFNSGQQSWLGPHVTQDPFSGANSQTDFYLKKDVFESKENHSRRKLKYEEEAVKGVNNYFLYNGTNKYVVHSILRPIAASESYDKEYCSSQDLSSEASYRDREHDLDDLESHEGYEEYQQDSFSDKEKTEEVRFGEKSTNSPLKARMPHIPRRSDEIIESDVRELRDERYCIMVYGIRSTCEFDEYGIARNTYRDRGQPDFFGRFEKFYIPTEMKEYNAEFSLRRCFSYFMANINRLPSILDGNVPRSFYLSHVLFVPHEDFLSLKNYNGVFSNSRSIRLGTDIMMDRNDDSFAFSIFKDFFFIKEINNLINPK